MQNYKGSKVTITDIKTNATQGQKVKITDLKNHCRNHVLYILQSLEDKPAVYAIVRLI